MITCWHFHTVWKNAKFTLTEKIFRQINSLVTYLVKQLLSRNFCQNCVRMNSTAVWYVHNFENFPQSQIFFVKLMYSRTLKWKSWFDGIFSKNRWGKIIKLCTSLPHCVQWLMTFPNMQCTLNFELLGNVK